MIKKQLNTTEKIKKSDVLALDIATHTGYHSVYEGGTWDFSECWKRNQNNQSDWFLFPDILAIRTLQTRDRYLTVSSPRK